MWDDDEACRDGCGQFWLFGLCLIWYASAGLTLKRFTAGHNPTPPRGRAPQIPQAPFTPPRP